VLQPPQARLRGMVRSGCQQENRWWRCFTRPDVVAAVQHEFPVTAQLLQLEGRKIKCILRPLRSPSPRGVEFDGGHARASASVLAQSERVCALQLITATIPVTDEGNARGLRLRAASPDVSSGRGVVGRSGRTRSRSNAAASKEMPSTMGGQLTKDARLLTARLLSAVGFVGLLGRIRLLGSTVVRPVRRDAAHRATRA